MDKNEFKEFCKNEFYKRGYKKLKNMYYYLGPKGILCGIELQKSNFSNSYYVNFYFFIGDYEALPIQKYPTKYDHDIYGRIIVMSVKEKSKEGKVFKTGAIEYEEYTQETLEPYFTKAFDVLINPPVYEGKKYILDNIDILYFLTIRQDEMIEKLMS